MPQASSGTLPKLRHRRGVLIELARERGDGRSALGVPAVAGLAILVRPALQLTHTGLDRSNRTTDFIEPTRHRHFHLSR